MRAGDNIKLKLRNVEESDVQPGYVVCSPDAMCRVGRVFDGEVLIREHKSIIAAGYQCVLHIHAATEEIQIKVFYALFFSRSLEKKNFLLQNVICTIDKKTNEKKVKRFVKQDDKCILRFESPEPFCLELFKDFQQMGRFTLRDEGRTMAIGKVVKIVE